MIALVTIAAWTAGILVASVAAVVTSTWLRRIRRETTRRLDRLEQDGSFW